MDQNILILQSTPERIKLKRGTLMNKMHCVVQFTCLCLLMLGAAALQAQEPIHSTSKTPDPASSPAKMDSQPVTPQ